MKKTKRNLSLFLAIAITVTGFAGCGKKQDNTSANTGDRLKLTYVSPVTGTVKTNTLVETKIEEWYPDIDISFLALERETYQQQLNTRVAGGDIPEIIYREWYSVVQEYAEQNIIAEVPYEKIKDWAPKYVDESIDYGIDVWLATEYQGKNYGLPFMQPNQNYPATDYWRTDWLENVGIDKIPETLEEYEEALRRFTFNDPDGNGKNDTYGLTWPAKSNADIFITIYNAFGAKAFEGDGQDPENLKRNSQEEIANRTREATELLKRWYSEGLIDPEFVTTDNATLKQKWCNGQIGFFPTGTWYRIMPGGEHSAGLLAINPEAKFEMGPAPKGPDGYFGYSAAQKGTGAITSSITFSSALNKKDGALEKAVRLMYDLLSDSEKYNFVRNGIEGTHWKRDETAAVTPISPYDLPQNCGDLGTNMFNLLFYGLPSVQSDYYGDDVDKYTEYAKQGNVFGWPKWVDIYYGQQDDRITDTGEFSNAKWLINFISGKTELNDENWNKYIDESKNIGKTHEIYKIKERVFNESYDEIMSIENKLK